MTRVLTAIPAQPPYEGWAYQPNFEKRMDCKMSQLDRMSEPIALGCLVVLTIV